MLHTNTYETIVTGIAVVRNQEGKYLFLKRSDRDAYGSGLWDLPGGAKEFLETPEQGTLRECFEECGLHVTINKFLIYKVTRGEVDTSYEFLSFYFLCDAVSDEVSLSNEHVDYRWLTIEEAKKLDSVPWLSEFIANVESRQITL